MNNDSPGWEREKKRVNKNISKTCSSKERIKLQRGRWPLESITAILPHLYIHACTFSREKYQSFVRLSRKVLTHLQKYVSVKLSISKVTAAVHLLNKHFQKTIKQASFPLKKNYKLYTMCSAQKPWHHKY